MFGIVRSLVGKVLIGVLAFALVKGITGGTVDLAAVWQALTDASQQVEQTVPDVAKTVLDPVMEAPAESGGDSAQQKEPATTEK